MIFKIQHFWIKSWGDVIIPFVCSKCGECCSNLGTEWSLRDIDKASKYLKKEPIEFIKEYLEGKADKDEISYKKHVSPCPFLTKENNCEIYSARPIACRLYPLKTVLGASGIKCPSLILMNETIKKIGSRVPYTTTNHSIQYRKIPTARDLYDLTWNLPTEESCHKIKKRFLEVEKRKKARGLFLNLNSKIRKRYKKLVEEIDLNI